MARDPVSRQGVAKVSRDTSLTTPSQTPVMEVSQPDGDNFTGAGGESGLADPSLMLGILVTGGNTESAVGLTSTYNVRVRNPQFDVDEAVTIAVDITAGDTAAAVSTTLTATPRPGALDGDILGQVEITWATETTDQTTFDVTVTSNGGADGPFTESESGPRRIRSAAEANGVGAVATNTSLNFSGELVGLDSNTLTNIQTAFNNAVTRVNQHFQVSGQSLINMQFAPTGGEGWAGMTVPDMNLFRDPGSDVLAFMVQSPVNLTFGGLTARQGIAASCIGIGVNISKLDNEGGDKSVADLTGILTHEILHGMGTPGAFFIDSRGFLRPGAIQAGALSNGIYSTVNDYYEANNGGPPGSGTRVPLISTSGGQLDHYDAFSQNRFGTQYRGITNDIMVGFFADDGSTNFITPISRLALQDQGYTLIGTEDAATTFNDTPVPLVAPVENFKLYMTDPDIQRDGGDLYEKYHKFS